MNQIIETTRQIEIEDELSQGELEMALEVTKKVRGHLNRLVYKESRVKYANNLIVLEQLVSKYRNKVIQRAVAV